MTDYLALIAEKEPDTLLEQARRLEGALSALAERKAGEELKTSSPPHLSSQNRENTEKAAGMGEETMALETAQQASALSQLQGSERRQAPHFPLLDQLRTLDGAFGLEERRAEAGAETQAYWTAGRTAARGGTAAERTGQLPHGAAPLPGAGAGAAGPLGGRAALQSSGEAAWAEQADRAFRRDSRRYDGGFYLY